MLENPVAYHLLPAHRFKASDVKVCVVTDCIVRSGSCILQHPEAGELYIKSADYATLPPMNICIQLNYNCKSKGISDILSEFKIYRYMSIAKMTHMNS